jgi:monoamine oxidase
MKRRDFLQQSLILGTGAALLPYHQLLARSAEQGVKVLIIGAGMSGLAAAKSLVAAGADVTILEGQNRAGGRVWTNRVDGIPMDMGAGWIHGPEGDNPITPLARAANARTYETDDASLKIYSSADGSEIDEEMAQTRFTESYEPLLERITEEALNTNPDISVRAMADRLQPGYFDDLLNQYMMTSYLEFDYGGPVEELSAKNFQSDERFPGKDVLFLGGYDAIVNHVKTELNILYSKVVNRIEYAESGVKVTTADGSNYEAKYVIVTVPLGVLKRNTITFAPALDTARVELINRMKMGYINKVFLVWDNAFWDPTLQYFGYTDPVKGKYPYFLNYRTFSDINCLVTFGFGNYGLTLESLTDAQIKDEVLVTLRKIFGNDVPEPKRVVVTRWNNDPFSYGAYSFAAVGTTRDDFSNLGEPVMNRLLFAGEHTSADYRATVHSAWLSGQREASRIIVWEELTSVIDPAAAQVIGQLYVFPNPATETDQLHVRFQLKQAAALSYRVIDLQGRTIAESQAEQHATGQQQWVIPCRDWNAGHYMVGIYADEALIACQVVQR